MKKLEHVVFGDENPSNLLNCSKSKEIEAALKSSPATKTKATETKKPQIMGEVRFELFQPQPRHSAQELEGLAVHLKELVKIFELQLPVMYSEDGSYISKLVNSREHRSLALFIGANLVGGITFKTWVHRGYYEIAFFALSPYTQGQGYGSILMNHLKQLAKEEKIGHFLTYADNTAIGFFKRQGFTDKITIKYSHRRYLKVYTGATLMQCTIRGVKATNEPDWTPCSVCSSFHVTPFMICCDHCEAWCHGDCVGVSQPVKGSWACPICKIEDGEE